MSLKTMTIEQIREDLRTLLLVWPDGIPAEQADRVNALKGELKRRGEDVVSSSPASSPARVLANPTMMSQEALEAELRKLSTSPTNDEAAQKRFADVRYELRQRNRAATAAAAEAKAMSSVPVRELELPDDDELKKNVEDMRSRQRIPTTYGSDDATKPGKLSPTKTTYERRAAREPAPVNVGGISVAAASGADIALTFELELNAQSTKVSFVRVLSLRQSELLIDMIREARLQTLDGLSKADGDAED